MTDLAKTMFNVVTASTFIGIIIILAGIILIWDNNRKVIVTGIVTFTLGLIIFGTALYAVANLFPVKHTAEVTDISVTYKDNEGKNSTRVESITLEFGDSSYTIPNSLRDVDSYIVNSMDDIDNFKNYGIVLDDELNYPLIKRKNKDDFKSYLEDKFIERTYKDIK